MLLIFLLRAFNLPGERLAIPVDSGKASRTQSLIFLPAFWYLLTRGTGVASTSAAMREAFEGRIVHGGSLTGGCVWQLVVTVLVMVVLVKTRVVLVRVRVDLEVVVTRLGITLTVRVNVVEGKVVVKGASVVVSTLVIVVVRVLVGVSVTGNVAVGVSVTIFGGPAMMSNVRIQANVNPSTTTIHSPDII